MALVVPPLVVIVKLVSAATPLRVAMLAVAPATTLPAAGAIAVPLLTSMLLPKSEERESAIEAMAMT